MSGGDRVEPFEGVPARLRITEFGRRPSDEQPPLAPIVRVRVARRPRQPGRRASVRSAAGRKLSPTGRRCSAIAAKSRRKLSCDWPGKSVHQIDVQNQSAVDDQSARVERLLSGVPAVNVVQECSSSRVWVPMLIAPTPRFSTSTCSAVTDSGDASTTWTLLPARAVDQRFRQQFVQQIGGQRGRRPAPDEQLRQRRILVPPIPALDGGP